MSKYQVLFKNDSSMYTDGCPLIILSHALTLDSEKDAVLAQIKFQNLDQRMVKAVYIDIKCTGVANEELESIENYAYLDLRIRPNQQFGGDIPVYLPDRKTRKVEIRCNKIIFSDDRLWENGSEDFYDKFPPKVLLNDIMEPKLFTVLIEEVRKSGVHCNELYFPSKIKSFRLCACGKYNWQSEPVCWNCGHDADWWKTRIAKEYLIQKIEEKEENEKYLQLEKERLAEEKIINKKETIRKVKKCIIPVGIVAVVAIVLLVCTKVLLPRYYYNKGNELFNDHEYSAAIEYYEKVGDYKDSLPKKSAAENRIRQQELNDYYKKGMELFDEQKYDQAIEQFEKADGFGDSVQKISEAKILKESPGLLKVIEQGIINDEFIPYLAYLDMTYEEAGMKPGQFDERNRDSGHSYHVGQAMFLGDEKCSLRLWYYSIKSDTIASYIEINFNELTNKTAQELADQICEALNVKPYAQLEFDFCKAIFI